MDIYSTVPGEILEDTTLDPARANIYEYLQMQKGPKTAREIAKECGYKTTGTQVEVRKAITQLLEVDRKPIISVGKGFMIAEHPNQMRRYAERLLERCQGIERRARICREIANDL
jgi:glyoxylate carboligase